MSQKPNILLVMSDEHDPGIMGCYGSSSARTPNLDRLAAEGMTFDGCYTSSPLCVPARLSLTAGKYASRIGAWGNGCSMDDEIPSLPRILNAAGYDSILGGKMHYAKGCRYGFRELFHDSHNDRLPEEGVQRQRPDDTRIHHDSWLKRSAEFRVGEKSKVLNGDRHVTEECGRFLRERKKGDDPFFLLAGYMAPHFPLIVPEEYYRPFEGKIPMPEIPDGLLEKLPLNYQHLRRSFGYAEATPEITRKGRELYWGLVSWMDAEVGKLLASMSPEVADNTVVIYTSDHGENKGDHGLWWKNCMYEHSARVPLIVRWPKRWKGGQRRKGACSLLDLVQSMVELGGGKAPEDWDGDSMIGWMDDSGQRWKDRAITEYYGHHVASGITMIREGKFKYVYHARMDERHGPERELYDLEKDPREFCNLAGDPAHTGMVQRLHQAMVDELGGEPDEIELRCRGKSDYQSAP